MRLPDFITFTGVDDRTNVHDLLRLSLAYFPRVEFGVLMSKSRTGLDNRYPGPTKLAELAAVARQEDRRLRLSAHICGEWARSIMEHTFPTLPVSLEHFLRLQVNHAEPTAHAIFEAVKHYDVNRGIGQFRSHLMPDDRAIDWLYDRSGGRGEVPASWPSHSESRRIGFAGGLTPENIRSEMVRMRPAGPYWLDMESGVRVDDWFSIGRAVKVCDEVFRQAWGD